MAKYIYYNHDLFLLIRRHSLLQKKDSNQDLLNRLAFYIIIYNIIPQIQIVQSGSLVCAT
jgi:hypothetical protein